VERRVNGLYCLVAIAFWYWTPGSSLALMLSRGEPWYVNALVLHFYADLLLLAFVAGAIAIGRPTPQEVIGRAPSRNDALPIAVTVAITFCASGAFTTLTMIPLSYVLPAFVDWWLEWSYPFTLYVADQGRVPIAANALRLFSLVVTTPILEELIFRGYLLHAWSRKWGLWMGVLLSSAMFGLIHADTVPAMLTGVGFAVLYLKTRTLWAPIIAHAAYNAVVSVWGIAELASNGWIYQMPSLEEFREAWWLGVLQLLVVAVLLDQVMRRGALGPLRLPATAERL
jgi:hypothetical protein